MSPIYKSDKSGWKLLLFDMNNKNYITMQIICINIYLKQHNCVQVISIRYEYLKPYNCANY